MKMNFDQRLQAYTQAIEAYLGNCFLHPELPQGKLFEAMRYSLLAGGKRLRPIYVMEFCRICGGDWLRSLPLAAAMEMVHTYSLIHDDLPCMDDDDYRRGKLTNHKVFGEANAVLAGDALLTEAFSTVVKAEISAPQLVQAVCILAKAAGAFGMVGGQVLDLQAEGTVCTEQALYEIHSRKTGALFSAACKLGVVAANGSAAQLASAEQYAQCIGLAFQIRDDMLDVIGSQQKLGKATGMDKNKNTFAQLYDLETCETLIEQQTQQALDCLKGFEDCTFLQELSLRLANRDH